MRRRPFSLDLDVDSILLFYWEGIDETKTSHDLAGVHFLTRVQRILSQAITKLSEKFL